MTTYGYARVSSKNQVLSRQLERLKEAGVEEENIFSEVASGKDFDREVYQDLKSILKPSDYLIITDLSRLGRNNIEIKKEWEELNSKCGGIYVTDMPILDTRANKNPSNKLVSDIVFTVLAWEVEYDRMRRLEAQADGIKIARQLDKTKYSGKPRKFTENHPQVKLAFELYDEGKKSVNDIIKQTGLTKPTFYRRLKERENNQNRYNV